jgi:hypothetical protein
MNTAAILASMGRDLPDPLVIDTVAHGPWFQMMWGETTLTDQQLGACDIGLMNLKAAIGLPGAENLNLDACVRKLNAWAGQVQIYTEENWHRFQRSPEDYDFSRGYFLMLALVTFVQRRLGVRYNLSFSEGDYNATDSRNLFLHGILGGHGGTCATMPVLYAALAHRLGYPLYLVRAKEHMFARWEGPGTERFNIECTSPGFRTPPDEHYHRWPKPLSTKDLAMKHYLRSLRPREALATFLAGRASCLIDHLRLGEALLSSCLAG